MTALLHAALTIIELDVMLIALTVDIAAVVGWLQRRRWR
jgi:hypothetical protein